MNGAPFSWRGLQCELQASPYLDLADDLSTQRGLVAAAMAILDRMSGDTGNVSWTPARMSTRRTAALASQALHGPPVIDGGQLVKAAPEPSQPRPGGAAVAVPALEIIW